MLIRKKNGELKEIIYDKKKLYQYCLNRLNTRSYLSYELIEKMKNLQPDLSIINEIIDKLKGLGYINDEQYILNFLEKYASKESYNKTSNRLLQKGAPKGLVNEVLIKYKEGIEEGVELESSLNLLEKKFKIYDSENYEKMVRFLVSKGFKFGEISKIIKDFKNKLENE